MDLQDVLLAFCIHNPNVGYCQGMNFLVAMALLFMDAQDAFWSVTLIVSLSFLHTVHDFAFSTNSERVIVFSSNSA